MVDNSFGYIVCSGCKEYLEDLGSETISMYNVQMYVLVLHVVLVQTRILITPPFLIFRRLTSTLCLRQHRILCKLSYPRTMFVCIWEEEKNETAAIEIPVSLCPVQFFLLCSAVKKNLHTSTDTPGSHHRRGEGLA